MPNPRIPIIVDTDISLGTPNAEIDDGAALMLLARSSGVAIRALTAVHGNAPVAESTTNLMRMAAYLQLTDVPLARGAAAPLVNDPEWGAFLTGWQAQYGPTPDASGPVSELHAADLIVETARQHPREVVIVALGPLTNLALALQRFPPLSGMVRGVYAMGGSLEGTGQAEFNIRCDPEAAHRVFQAGWPLYLHGLEITRQALFTPQDFANLDPKDPAQALLRRQAPGWIRIVESQGWETGGCSLHDAVAAAPVIAPELFSYRPVRIEVETAFGKRRGLTQVRPEGPVGAVHVAHQVDAAGCRSLILEAVKQT